MPSGYTVNGVDLDSIFAPWHTGWPQAPATGYKIAGVDLNARYAPLSTGSGAAATGLTETSSRTDLNTYFAALGSTSVQVASQPSNVSGATAAGFPSGTVTSGPATCAFTKGSGSYTYTWVCTGCTANSPNSPTTTFSAVVSAGTTDNASAHCQGSDGVTSANTNTISVSLQNTTPNAFQFTITAGQPVGAGFSGYVQSGYGSIVPAGGVMDDGNTLKDLFYSFNNGHLQLEIQSASALVQSYVQSLVFNGQTLTGAGASFTSGATTFTWTWTGANSMTVGNSYPGSLTHT